ncbi:MAG: tetratricopeptide repeat protein [Dysgonomonas sp.]
MKYFLGSLLSFMISISAMAQNSPGVDYLGLGEIKLAKDYFEKTMRQSPAESNYYLGEIAFQEGNLSEAKAKYEAGLAGNPESALSAVGLAKLLLKSDAKEAENQLKEVQKKNKKDVIVILAIAKAYLDNGMKDKALEKLQDARKADKKNPYIYIFEGDMLAKEGKPGEAAQQYDQAINFDPQCVLAYMKGARVYEFINREQAATMMKKAIEIRPEYKIAYKELAQLYYRDGFYPQAIESYKEFIKGGDYTVEDLRRYSAAEYFTKNYDESMRLLEEGLQKNPNDFVLNRLLMYNSNELKDFQTGLTAGDKFFSLPLGKGDTILIQDYKAYATILSEVGNKAKAVEQYKKLITLDPNNKDLYKEVATITAAENMYEDASEFFKKYIELRGEEADAQDYFYLGRYYYFGAGNAAVDTVSQTKEQAHAKSIDLFKKADASFGTVTERMPDNYLGYFWRARTNAALDPETTQGLAKPYYEGVAKVLTAKAEPDDNDKKNLIEAYRYLAYYHYLQYVDHGKKAEDKNSIKTYSEKILELDPANETATSFLNFINQ